MLLAELLIKLILWIVEPGHHGNPHSLLEFHRDVPPVFVCDRHFLLGYTSHLVAEGADDSFWLQGLSIWPYLQYLMHLFADLVPPMLAPLQVWLLTTGR